MSLAKRLKERRLMMNFKSQRQFARAAKVPYATIIEIENGTRTLSKHLPEIAEVLETTVDYLLRGVINLPAISYKNKRGLGDELEVYRVKGDAVPMVPIIEWNEIKEWRGLPVLQTSKRYDMVPLYGTSGSHSYALTIKNDSMVSPLPNSDSFRPGDVIIIDPEKNIKVGSFVIASINDNQECVLRQLVEIAGKRFLIPLNPSYPKEAVDKHIKILGALSGSYRKHD